MKIYNVDFDCGFSWDVTVKARNATEAKAKAFVIMLKRFASKRKNWNIAWDEFNEDGLATGRYGGERAMTKCGYRW